jgi:hypothetical protein
MVGLCPVYLYKYIFRAQATTDKIGLIGPLMKIVAFGGGGIYFMGV